MKHPRYDAIAEWYDATIRDAQFAGDLVLSHVFDLIGDIAGRSVCDLGCGQGRVTRELARRGASVVGIDLSSQLINIAQRDEDAQPLGITYIVDDAECLATIDDAMFDGVICNLALMDIPDLAATLETVQRVLRPSGWFVFSITHPCFEAPHAEWRTRDDGTISREISIYFEEGLWFSRNSRGVRGQVGAQHRMLATYLNTLAQSGFVLEQLVEPRATAATNASVPGYRVVPPFMLIRCIKRGAYSRSNS